MRICPECGTKTGLFYCPNCGEILEFPSFVANNKTRKVLLQDYVKTVVSNAKQHKIDISSAIDASSLRNTLYRKYYERIAYLHELCSNKSTRSFFMNSGTNLFEHMNAFAEKCKSGECRIAVVGTVKAGKSAFINSLIGREIASSYPTPETASVTKFRKSEDVDYIKISFYTSNDWKELWDSVHESTDDASREDENEDFLHLYESLGADRIREEFLNKEDTVYYVKSLGELKTLVDRYTSARYPEHFFAKEVEIGLTDFFAPSNVVIVDTPGLDDPVRYRTDQTRNYLHEVDVVLLCIRSNRPEISSTELKQLSYIFSELRYSKDRIITIGTQIDEPDDMLNFWKEYTLPEYVKTMSRSTLYGSADIAKKHIFPVSALYYSYIRRVIDNPQIFLGKTDDDKKCKKKIFEIIRRYYDCPDFGELVDAYGEEEACKLYRSPRQIFEEHKEELLNMTQVPQIRSMILEGPIRNANDIILNDIKNKYTALNNEIKKVSSEIVSHCKGVIEKSEADDVIERISELESQISKIKKYNNEQAHKLSELLSDLERRSQNELKKTKEKRYGILEYH